LVVVGGVGSFPPVFSLRPAESSRLSVETDFFCFRREIGSGVSGETMGGDARLYRDDVGLKVGETDGVVLAKAIRSSEKSWWRVAVEDLREWGVGDVAKLLLRWW